MGLRRSELHTMAGAYALDALPSADRARFERHLARCRACAREQCELREATARLAGAVAADPPAHLIAQAVATAARTRQLPSAMGPAREPAARLPGQAGGARRLPGPWRARPRRLALAFAAAFVAAATAFGAIAFTAEYRLGDAQLRDHAVAEVLTAPDATLVTSRVKAGGAATIVMSHRDHALVFTTAGLPAPPAGRRYELWLMGPRGDRSAGLLPAPHGGMTSPVIATGLAAGDWVGLTVEPAGGSRHPTSRPVLMLSLAT
ncbi:MAG: anti-sigma factor [Nocardiopsaceae bacterium]|nr:anti-sigma factor [Nocardiopsaceae bacterium]